MSGMKTSKRPLTDLALAVARTNVAIAGFGAALARNPKAWMPPADRQSAIRNLRRAEERLAALKAKRPTP